MDLTFADYVRCAHGTRQADLTPRVKYDIAYLAARYFAIDDRVRALSCRRLQVLEAFVDVEALTKKRYGRQPRLLDYGAGTFRFAEAAGGTWRWNAYGYEPATPDHPLQRKLRGKLDAEPWDVVTFFDSLEHLIDPAGTIRRLSPRWLMVSVPECHYPHVPQWFMTWKHRRPGEHLWHWNRRSLAVFMDCQGYQEVMASSFEDEFRKNPSQPEPNILTAIYRSRR